MAWQYTNNKKFLVIVTTAHEVMTIEPGALGLCDRCGCPSMAGYIPCVLGHRYYCPDCFKDWMRDAKNYVEDRPFERQIFDEFVVRFDRASLWKSTKRTKK